MTGQLNRVDVTVLPVGWTNREPGSYPSEVSGSWSPALSPDGRHAAYVSDRSGSPQVWVQPVGSDLTFLVDTGEAPVVAVHWSTGGGWLACLARPRRRAPRTEVWLVRPDGSELHQVAGFGADTADNVRWLPGRSLLAVTENLTTTLLVDADARRPAQVIADGRADLAVRRQPRTASRRPAAARPARQPAHRGPRPADRRRRVRDQRRAGRASARTARSCTPAATPASSRCWSGSPAAPSEVLAASDDRRGGVVRADRGRAHASRCCGTCAAASPS